MELESDWFEKYIARQNKILNQYDNGSPMHNSFTLCRKCAKERPVRFVGSGHLSDACTQCGKVCMGYGCQRRRYGKIVTKI
jgi:hypothetical protein